MIEHIKSCDNSPWKPILAEREALRAENLEIREELSALRREEEDAVTVEGECWPAFLHRVDPQRWSNGQLRIFDGEYVKASHPVTVTIRKREVDS